MSFVSPQESAPGRDLEVVVRDGGRRRPWRDRLVGWLPHRKRVVVGAGRRAQAVGPLLEQRWRLAERGETIFFDAGHLDGRLTDCVRRERPDEVYFDLGASIDEHAMTRAGARLLMDGVTIHFVLPRLGRPPVRTRTTRLGSHSIVSLHAVADGFAARIVRRVVDVVGAALLLVLLAPLFAVLALLIRWKMGAPVFHAQQRVGKAGRLFRLFKFRSMVVDAEQRLRASPEVYQRYVAGNFKLPADEDVRITPLGRILRRTSLDELPQLWNVLRGDMSLVGPRAIVPDELAQYGDYARMLLRVRPGVTGLWQVSGRSTIDYPERARLDLQYAEERSLLKDLRILLRTLPVVIQQRGAL